MDRVRNILIALLLFTLLLAPIAPVVVNAQVAPSNGGNQGGNPSGGSNLGENVVANAAGCGGSALITYLLGGLLGLAPKAKEVVEDIAKQSVPVKDTGVNDKLTALNLSQGITTGNTTSLINKEYLLDCLAWGTINILIDQITEQTISWIRSGFQGSPAFVQDPSQLFLDVADAAIGDFIFNDRDLAFLCSPFGLNIKLALAFPHKDFKKKIQCKFSTVIGNVENFLQPFLNGDFASGGWQGWFELTQTPSNNAYGAVLLSNAELLKRLNTKVRKEFTFLDWNNGLFSKRGTKCEDVGTFEDVDADGNTFTRTNTICREFVQTPGSVIEAQLNNALDQPNRRLQIADELNEIISALIETLMRDLIFNSGNGLIGGDWGGKAQKAPFTYLLEPPNRTKIVIAGSTDIVVKKTSVSGDAKPVNIKILLPPGFEVVDVIDGNCSPTCTTTIRIRSIDEGIAPGTYQGTIIATPGSGGNTSESIPFPIEVVDDTHYSIEINPSTVNIRPGETKDAVVTRTFIDGRVKPIEIGLALPPGITANVPTNNPCTPTCNSFVTLTASATIAPGTYTGTIVAAPGSFGAASQQKTFEIIVPTPGAPIITLSAQPLTVNAGTDVTLQWSVGNLPQSCIASSNPSGVWKDVKSIPTGLDVVTINTSTTLTLTCGNTDGTTRESVTVAVSGGAIGGAACSDGIDNDGDGLRDHVSVNLLTPDPDCSSATDTSESQINPGTGGVAVTFVSPTQGSTVSGIITLSASVPEFNNVNDVVIFTAAGDLPAGGDIYPGAGPGGLFLGSFDTRQLPNGTHDFRVTAYGNDGKTGFKVVTVRVQN